MTLHTNTLLHWSLILALIVASPTAFAQSNLPQNASATAHQRVLDNVDPSVMAEVEKMKAEQRARSEESLSGFPSSAQSAEKGINLFVPASTPIIVVSETEDGDLVATEF